MRIQCTNCAHGLELSEWRESVVCPQCGEKVSLPRVETVKLSQPGGERKPSSMREEEVLEAGTVIGPYEIEGFIGRGGMGAVYRAKHAMLHRRVALKLLPAKFAKDPEFVHRFRREAQALAGLSHPSIVAVHDLGVQGEIYYFAMEFVSGLSLRELMAGGKLKPEMALKLVPQLCEALEYAHSQGVIHRDIKPENVLIDGGGRAKIADFGLAKIVNGEAKSELTQTNVVMGTADYMAPEQRFNMKQVDHRADIYSLGVMLYEMLTGEVPVGRFELPSRRVQVDIRLDDVVLRALERDPDRRYQRASQLGTDVSQVLSSEGAGADVGICLSNAATVWKKHWALLFAASLVNMVITIGSLGLLSGPMAGGVARMYLDAVRTRQLQFGLLFSGFRKFFPLLGLFFLEMVILIPAFLLFIAPGVILSFRWMYAYYLVMEHGLGPIRALKASWRLTSKPYRGRHFGLWLMNILFSQGPHAIPYLGVFIVLFIAPIGHLMIAYAYSVVGLQRAGLIADLKESKSRN